MSGPSTPTKEGAASSKKPSQPKPDNWLSQRERGTVWLIHLTFRLAQLIGRTLIKPVIVIVAMFYRLTDRKAVRASRLWLTKVHGKKPGFWAIYRHIHTFAQVTIDRIFLVSGKTRGLKFTRTGDHHLAAQYASGRGAVLLGGHLGSFEAMRNGGNEDEIKINILGHFANAKMINELLTRLDPERAATVIHIGDDPVGQMARVHDRIEAGDFVALLGDRTGLNERTIEVTFFGETAHFPAGPFLLASLMKCPVYLTFGLYRRPNQYDLSCEPFADKLHIPRKDREAGLKDIVQRYADRLEHYARQAPENWFNFYDFWNKERAPEASRTRHHRKVPGGTSSV
ncbi:MAG: putative LPLAT superfamily acyltransferase [Planctomycetota bacterium]|jgi:predicted LPLAT superfamily acyltransferase